MSFFGVTTKYLSDLPAPKIKHNYEFLQINNCNLKNSTHILK